MEVQILLNNLLLILLMLTAKPTKLILEEAVLHSLLLVLHVIAEHADVLHSLFLILLMLTEKAANVIANDADVDVHIVLMNGLLLMPRSLRHMLTTKLVVLNGLLLVLCSLLLVLQMFRANASSQEYSCKGRGF